MKNDLELQVLFDECIEHWGLEKQLRVLQEECGELIVAISHFLRERQGALENLKEELADVQLMSRQIIHCIGQEDVIKYFDYKSDRTVERLAKSKEKLYGN